jgi:hypothetical protein
MIGIDTRRRVLRQPDETWFFDGREKALLLSLGFLKACLHMGTRRKLSRAAPPKSIERPGYYIVVPLAVFDHYVLQHVCDIFAMVHGGFKKLVNLFDLDERDTILF